MSRFALGFNELLSAFGLFKRDKGLWWYSIIPTILNLLVLVLAFFLMFKYYGGIFNYVISFLHLSEIKEAVGILAHIWAGVIWSLNLIIKILLFLIIALVIFLATYLFAQIIVSPFNDALSEKVEEIISGVPMPAFTLKTFFKNVLRTLKVEVIKALFFLSVPLVLLVLNFIPVAGGIIYSALTLGFGIWDLGLTYVDYPMSRRMWGFKERLKFARENYRAIMGLGVIFVIPFFAFLFTAPMTIAGTTLFLKLKEKP